MVCTRVLHFDNLQVTNSWRCEKQNSRMCGMHKLSWLDNGKATSKKQADLRRKKKNEELIIFDGASTKLAVNCETLLPQCFQFQ